MKSNNNIFQTTLILAIFTILLGGLFTSPVTAYSDGSYVPGVGDNVTTIGTELWLYPGEITAPGSPYSMVDLYHLHTYSNYLTGTHYGFNFPSDVVIVGIEVNVNRMSSGHNPSILDNVVSLVLAGDTVGENRASPDTWPTTLTVATYGGPTDLWGTTWTPAEINSPDFGASLAAVRNNNGNNLRTATVDTIQITVYYIFTATTTVECGDGSPVMYGKSVVCVASVSSTSSDLTPSGNIDWTTDGDGTFDLTQCLLEGVDGLATCSTTYTPKLVGSGTHAITAMYSGDEFFAPSDTQAVVAVSLRPVSVTADTQSKVYNDPDPELTYQVSQGSLAFNDTFTGTLTRESGEEVGTYAILQGTLALPENYILTYVGDFLNITPIGITIMADSQTKRFGEPDPMLTYQIASGMLLPGDTIAGELTREPGEDMETYAILQGTLSMPAYYEISFVGADFTITGTRIMLPLVLR